ncbi:flavin reductase family protein [Mesorhizobium sp. M1006]|uniref:flavin reductase family protein n=1 Tax=Mesorhizobium sp. M1006 TaxID=2957048 RepID=UPI0033375D31
MRNSATVRAIGMHMRLLHDDRPWRIAEQMLGRWKAVSSLKLQEGPRCLHSLPCALSIEPPRMIISLNRSSSTWPVVEAPDRLQA